MDYTPIIILKGLEGNEPTTLKGVQLDLMPHLDILQFGWWLVLVVTLCIVIMKNVVIPWTHEFRRRS